MKKAMPVHRSLLFAIILIAGSGLGCAAGGYDVATPQGNAVKYPSVMNEDARRRQVAIDNWNAYLKGMNLQPVAPELEQVTCSIRSLPAPLAGRLRIVEKDDTLSPLEAREALRKFIDSHAELFFGDAGISESPHKMLSLTAFSEDGSFYRATWTQTNYPYEIKNGYGSVNIAISRQGALLQLSSRLIPSVAIPSEPTVTSRQLIDRMVGRVFTYSNIAGQSQTYRVESTDEVRLGKAVVYPVLKESSLEIRLALPVEVGRGMTWTIFIDAIEGIELAVRQNFQS